jgi:hypothetical protein
MNINISKKTDFYLSDEQLIVSSLWDSQDNSFNKNGFNISSGSFLINNSSSEYQKYYTGIHKTSTIKGINGEIELKEIEAQSKLGYKVYGDLSNENVIVLTCSFAFKKYKESNNPIFPPIILGIEDTLFQIKNKKDVVLSMDKDSFLKKLYKPKITLSQELQKKYFDDDFERLLYDVDFPLFAKESDEYIQYSIGPIDINYNINISKKFRNPYYGGFNRMAKDSSEDIEPSNNIRNKYYQDFYAYFYLK